MVELETSERKKLRNYLLSGGIQGKYFMNKAYDPANPLYLVEDIRVLGAGSTKRMTVIDYKALPKGNYNSHDLTLRFEDLEATPEEIRMFGGERDCLENQAETFLALKALDEIDSVARSRQS